MFNTMLVPTDGSALGEKAVHAAAELAKSTHGKIIGLAVAASPIPIPPWTMRASFRIRQRMTTTCWHSHKLMWTE
jgi:nucleotide-binding universal stress UspA family protein